MKHHRPPDLPDSAVRPSLASLTTLLDGSHLATADQLPEIVTRAGRELGCQVLIYLVDLDQRHLVPFLPPGVGARDRLGIDGTMAGRAFATVRPCAGDTVTPTLWVPLLDGVERLGVLEVTPVDDGALTDPTRLQQLSWFSMLLGHMVSVMTPYGDAITRLRGGQRRTVAAEMVWNLLPPLTYACPGLVVSGLLEPCHAVAGDVFDYAVNDDIAHFAILDATGHDTRSGVLSALALAAYRNSRRQGRGLYDLARAMDELLAEHQTGQGYATGLLGELELPTGRLRYLNAGHPPPLLLRGGKVVKSLDGGRRALLGLDQAAGAVAEEWLEPGDRVVLYTDGITEARDDAGAFFGVERLTDLLERSALAAAPPPETLRRVVKAVLEHQRDVLQDDATLLLVEWGRGSEQQLLPT
jgi:phosphoserine phosphatase RsbU/P